MARSSLLTNYLVFLVVAVGCVIGGGGSGDNYDGDGGDGASWTRHPWTEDKFLHSPKPPNTSPIIISHLHCGPDTRPD